MISSKYKFVNSNGIYFVTATVVDWVDILQEIFTGIFY